MYISCFEVNSNSDFNILSLRLDNYFNVESASCEPVCVSVINTINSFCNNEISFEEVIKSIRYYNNINPSFIILTTKQFQRLSSDRNIITVGKPGQQIYLFNFNHESFRKVLCSV